MASDDKTELALELSVFEPLVGDTFRVTPAEGPEFEAQLASVVATPYGDPSTYDDRRLPFSLTFSAGDGAHVTQQTCMFTHATAGATSLFVVPLGPVPGGGGMRYEAVIA